ncbi:hypothetical protein BC829DRAFT_396403 [Chytridium lagenaria]|nr:hypothetical protein BC829DRAFT_396403 [Chytridium lagenaria]
MHPRLRPLKMPLPENKYKTKYLGSVSTTFQGLDNHFSQASRGSSRDFSLDAVAGIIKKLYQDIDEARALASMEMIDSLSSERMIPSEAMIIASRFADNVNVTSRQSLKPLASSGTLTQENVARASFSQKSTMPYKSGVGNPSLTISTALRTHLSKLAQSALMGVDNADDNSTHTFILSSTRSCVYDKTFQALPQVFESVDSMSDLPPLNFEPDSVLTIPYLSDATADLRASCWRVGTVC